MNALYVLIRSGLVQTVWKPNIYNLFRFFTEGFFVLIMLKTSVFIIENYKNIFRIVKVDFPEVNW